MKPEKKKKQKENPYLSMAEIEEREEFEKRNRRIKIGLLVGIPIALVALYFLISYATSVQMAW